MNKKIFILVLLISSLWFAPQTFAEEEGSMRVPNFTDVSQENKHFTAIEYLFDRDIIEGYKDGSFGYQSPINRAEMMKIVVEGLGHFPDEEKYNRCFPDVQNQWHARYICFAKEKKWIDGYGDGFFHPDRNVTNAQVAKIIVNAFGDKLTENYTEIALTSLKDVGENDWFRPYVSVVKNKLLEGENLEWYYPHFNSSRGKVVELFYRAMLVSEQGWKAHHDYLEDEFLKANELEYLITQEKTCYPFSESLDFPYFWDYLEGEYGIALSGPRNIEAFVSDLGYFCPLVDRGMVFSNVITPNKDEVQRHLIRFDGEGNLVKDEYFDCPVEERNDGGYNTSPIARAFNITEMDPETLTLMGCDHAKDVNQVRFDETYSEISKPIEKVDVESFEVLNRSYARDKDRVYYDENIVHAGRDEETFLPIEVDPENFQVINNGYAKDSERVYSGASIVQSRVGRPADLQSFEVLNENYGKDADWGYYQNTGTPKYEYSVLMRGENFRPLGNNYATDGNRIIYRSASTETYNQGDPATGKQVPVDPSAFEEVDKNYATYKDNVYFRGEVLPGADPDSFKILKFPYSKDANHVYLRNEMIEGANPNTFEIISDYESSSLSYYALGLLSKDDDQVFDELNQITSEGIIARIYRSEGKEKPEFDGIDAPSFEYLSPYYYKDENYVYYMPYFSLNWLEEADAQTFRVVKEYLPEPFAVDKNHVYCEDDVISDDPENFDFLAHTSDCPKYYPIYYHNLQL